MNLVQTAGFQMDMEVVFVGAVPGNDRAR